MSKYHRLAWDEESKQRARKEIHNHKPWLKSTGAKTKEGKEISKMNAKKNDCELNSLIKEFSSLLKRQKKTISYINN